MKKPGSFLIINPFGIGDVLFSTPVIRNLNRAFPEAKIFYLCNKRTRELLANHPLIHHIFVYERDDFEAEKGLARIRKYWRFIRDIRNARIDAAIDLSLNSKFGFFALAAGIPRRLGLDFKKRGRFLTRKKKITGFENKHVASHYLDVLSLLPLQAEDGRLEVYPSADDRDWVRQFIQSRGINHQTQIIGLAPCGGEAFGPNAMMKRWPLEHFRELINRILEKYDAHIFLYAGPKEKAEIHELLAGVPRRERCHEFTDASLSKIVALVEHNHLFIGNDTGPLRFADALNKKIIAFFGPVDETVYGTYPFIPSRHRIYTREVPCRPCYQKFRLPPCPYDIRCLKEIAVDEVYAGVEKLLQNDAEPELSGGKDGRDIG